MAATVQIGEKNSAGGAFTDKTGGTIRFKNADDANVDLNSPLVKPAAGSEWSFEKWLRFKENGGVYTQISNIKAYFDGANSFGAGVSLWAKAVANFATPQEGTASAGYSNAFGYTSGAPLSLGAGPFSGAGEKGDHLVLLMELATTVAGGMLPAETLTFAWDEI